MTEEIFRHDAYLRTCDATVAAVDEGGLRLDRTVFYPEGGGQPGDVGVLTLADGRSLTVTDTRKAENGDVVHILDEPPESSLMGAMLVATIDWERRHRLMRVHTCLHLLCSLIPEDVTGGSIRDNGTGRLDFNIPDPRLDKEALTRDLNALVAANHSVGARWITDDEMSAAPELVRTMSVKPPMGQGQVRLLEIEGVDLQPCGGTHVAATAEIGEVRVAKIEKKGRQNRRVNIALVD